MYQVLWLSFISIPSQSPCELLLDLLIIFNNVQFQRFIKKCYDFEDKGESEIYERVEDELRSEGLILKTMVEIRKVSHITKTSLYLLLIRFNTINFISKHKFKKYIKIKKYFILIFRYNTLNYLFLRDLLLTID